MASVPVRINRSRTPELVESIDTPPVKVVSIAYLPCGCAALCGTRPDTDGPAVLAAACSDDHMPMMVEFVNALADVEPSERALVDVVAERMAHSFES